ncbi:WXG100 family type VII secretion target [Kitasatospora camelliae]|uniref:PPE domain-containing protein n=1 Tax=Kitasatospora camelliae TaxID=3156397 RepID=A0AAU8JV98_9ACTN
MSDTNFSNFSHGELIKMVQSMDSGSVMAASDPWRRAYETLKQIRTALNTASADATTEWDGSTSDAFHSKMTALASTVNNTAAYALDAANAMQHMSEAIDAAKRSMPEEPGFWDKVGDDVSDFGQGLVGDDSKEAKTEIEDEKKAEAVAVMQTLASKYQSTTNFLKPPTGFRDDVYDLPAPDSGGPAALSAMLMGGGMGLAGASRSTGGGGTATASRTSSPSTPTTPKSPEATLPRPTDSGIKGGTANPAPAPKAPSIGTGIDGVSGGTLPANKGGIGTGNTSGGPGSNHAGGGGIAGGVGGGGIGTGGSGGTGGGLKGGTAGGSGIGGRSGAGGAGGTAGGRNSGAFGAGGMDGAGGNGNGNHSGGGGAKGGGAGGGAAGGSKSGLVRKGGGVVGEAGRGGAGGRAFTEGGSGIGRGRGQAGQGGSGQGHGMPGGSQAGKKDKKDGKERPDYLVEDEETWASGQAVNPNVVE